MRLATRFGTLAALALFAASCAGPAKLAQQSQQALAQGDLRKAYDRARRAVERDPLNAAARAAYDSSAARVAADFRQRVTATAAGDTVAAAGLALEYRAFRSEVADHQSALPASPAWDASEKRLLTAASRAYYRQGRDEMAAAHPKAAWRAFTDARRYDETYADVVKRQAAAWEAAVKKVAVLPFWDGIGIEGLAVAIGRQTAQQVKYQTEGRLKFTEIVPDEAVQQRVTLAQVREMSRENALAIGRKLGADRVVAGHFSGLRSDNDLQDLTVPLWHRVTRKDPQGHEVEDWVESSLRVVRRERHVTVQYDFDVLDVETGAVLAHRQETARTTACTVWTDFRPEGDVDRYALLPPEVRKSEPSRARKLDEQWNERVGSWSVPKLLEQARDARARSQWDGRYRDEFLRDTEARPVWLGELPPENDLAFVALHDLWKPVNDVLRELDPKD